MPSLDDPEPPGADGQPRGGLPDLIVIGAMKCATSAVHRYLDAHPAISMSSLKELNFFSGPPAPPDVPESSWWRHGQWHRGLDWYRRQFDGSAALRGESSPAYTSPTEPHAARRMASVVPDVRLVYLVRDPLRRALSQYAHHHRDGTERRDVEEALLDPASQYVSRSRYHERLLPYLRHFRRDQTHVVVQERLLAHRASEVSRIYDHVGAHADWRHDSHAERHHVGGDRPQVAERLRRAFAEAVADDVERLRQLLDDDLAEWDHRA